MSKYSKMLKAYKSRSSLVDYSPLHLYVEPTNGCNLNCRMCPGDKMKRPIGFMDMGLYYEVIEQMRDLGIKWLYLFHIGEPTLHPLIAEMVAGAKLVGLKTRLHTNGTYLPTAFLGVDKLVISANDTPWKRLRETVAFLLGRGLTFEIATIAGIPHNIPDEFHYLIKKKPLHNWHGDTIGAVGDGMLCSQPYKTMVVLWNGKVVPCCVSYEEKHVIGDASTEWLKDIWNAKRMQQIRSRGFSQCRLCSIQRIPEEEQSDHWSNG